MVVRGFNIVLVLPAVFLHTFATAGKSMFASKAGEKKLFQLYKLLTFYYSKLLVQKFVWCQNRNFTQTIEYICHSVSLSLNRTIQLVALKIAIIDFV